MSQLRAVMDTNVLVAAFRSRNGASFEIFRRLRHGVWVAVVSNHLLYEYEEVLKREADTLNLSFGDIDQILNAVCARAEERSLIHGWEPILPDPDDEPLVQLAHESGSIPIVTHNVRDLRPAIQIGIQILKPNEFLAKLRVADEHP